jgi:hypothetical protein
MWSPYWGQGVFEVVAVEDQYPVEQLAAEGADPSFGDCVRPGRLHRRAQDADAFVGAHGIEDGGELGVAILDQEGELRCAVAQVHQQVPCLLSDPGTAGVRCDTQEVDAAGGVLDDEQDGPPLEQQGVDAEEVGGEDAVGWGGQELSPGGTAAAGRGRPGPQR